MVETKKKVKIHSKFTNEIFDRKLKRRIQYLDLRKKK
jgi:hypothetical protein